jgi:predicted nuclease of predicted toxin-antitoxin system
VPKRGSSDLQVIEYALKANQVVVTSNHDMMMLCEEATQQFVWLDPRGKQLRKSEQALLALSQVHSWAEILASDPAVCVRALRTKCLPIEATEAVRLARQRMKSIERRRRTKTARPVGNLLA